MNIHNVEFIKSVTAIKDIPSDRLPRFVFAGKSNVGKSSVINKLLNRKQFARVSSTPGKTVHINYFLVDKTAYLIDLPGYGYAKVARSEYSRWAKLMESFFAQPDYITLGVMIVDARHKPTADDVTMATLFKAAGCSVIVLANKIDKVKKSEHNSNIALIRETLNLPEAVEIIHFSAVKGTGRDTLIARIKECLDSKSK